MSEKKFEEKKGYGYFFKREKHPDKYPDWDGYLVLKTGERIKIKGWNKNEGISLAHDTYEKEPKRTTRPQEEII